MPVQSDFWGPSPYEELLRQKGSPLAPAAPLPGYEQRAIGYGIKGGAFSPGQPFGQQQQPAPPLNPHMGGQGGPGPMPFGAPAAPPAPPPPGGGVGQPGFFGANSNALIHGGLQLMGGGGAQGLASGFAYGQGLDTKANDSREKKAQQARAKEALKKAFPGMAQALDGFDDPSDALRFIQGQQTKDYQDRSLSLQEKKLGQPEYMTAGDGMIYEKGPGGIKPTGLGGSRAKTNEQIQAERIDNLKRAGIDPESPQGKHYSLTGDLPKDAQRPWTSDDRKFVRTNETAAISLQTGINELERAYNWANPRLDKDGKLVTDLEDNRGPLAPVWNRTSGYRDATGVAANDATKKTVEFNKIMRNAAIQQVLSQFKGATTDTELNQSLEIVGDGTASVEARMFALKRILRAAYEERDGKLDQIEEAYKVGNQKPGALFERLAANRGKRVFSEDGGDDGVLFRSGDITIRKAP